MYVDLLDDSHLHAVFSVNDVELYRGTEGECWTWMRSRGDQSTDPACKRKSSNE